MKTAVHTVTPVTPPPSPMGHCRSPRVICSRQKRRPSPRQRSGAGTGQRVPMPASASQRLRKGLAALAAAALLASLLPAAAQAQERPEVTEIRLFNGAGDSGPYKRGNPYSTHERIWIGVKFSEMVALSDDSLDADLPTLSLTIGGRTRTASWGGTVGPSWVQFVYIVVAGDAGRIRVSANALRDNGNTIYRRSGNSGNAGDHADLSHAPMDLGNRVGVPTRVTNLKAASAGDGQLKVTWTAATYAPRGYRLFYRENRDGSPQPRWTPAVSGAVITGLKNGQEYVIRVDTLNEDGTALDSTAVYATGTPGVPTHAPDLKASPGNGQLTVTWTAAASAPRGYRLFYRDRGTNVQKRWTPAVSGAVITGLKNGQEYTIRVDTLNYDGKTADNTAVYATGTPGVPTEVTDLAVESGNRQLTVTWTAATYAPRGYRLSYRERTPGSALRQVTPAVSGAVITGLKNSQEYVIRVDTLDADGNAVNSTAVRVWGTPDGPPTRVADLSVEATAKGELTARWTAASYAPNGYRLRWRKINGGFNQGRKLAASKTSAEITGLDDGATYRVRIDSLNADDSRASGTAAAKDGRTLSEAAPDSLRLTAGMSGEINVSWSAGSGARGHRVRWRQLGAAELSAGRVVGSGTTATDITGLAAGKQYIVRVDALDSSNNIIAGASAKASLTLTRGPRAPTVTDIKLIAGKYNGAAYAGGPYETGDTIWVSVKFSESVSVKFREEVTKVTENSLGYEALLHKITLLIGDQERTARWHGHFGDTELRFGYKVAAQDAGPIRIRANSLRDRGNTIYRRSGDVNAEADQAALAHNGADTGYRVGRVSRVRGLEAVAGDRSLGVSWMAAADAPDGYLVRWRLRQANSELSKGEAVKSGTAHTVTGLTNDQTYVVRVDKLDTDSNVVRRTNAAVAGTPAVAGAPTKPRNLQLAPGSAAGTIDVSWDAALTAPNGYLVRWRASGQTELNAGLGVPSGADYTITGLTAGTTYIVRVDTRDRDGNTVAGASASASLSAPDVPVGVTVGDAMGAEREVLEFSVTLSSGSTREVRVNWRTEPGTARAGHDYESGSGELVFAPGEMTKTVQVQTLDDAHNDPDETFLVLLSDAQGATIDDGEAVGTITNDDPMPAGWLARFGRAAAEQVLDGITRRIAAPRTAGHEGTLAGYSVGGAALDGEFGDLPDGPSAFGGGMTSGGFNSGMGVGFGNGMGGMDGSPPYAGHSMTFGEMLAASSFALVGEADGAGRSVALWGRGARSSFQGMDGAARVDGTLTSALLGADYGGGRWLAGLALSRTVGEGGYRQPGAGGGRIRATLGAAVPYVSLNASARLSLWAAAGGGTGALTLTPDGAAPTKADIDWRMAALGLRGDLLAGGSGAALAFVSDALWTRTESDRAAAQGAATSLAASSSATSRLRLGLEGSWPLPLGLTPQLEVGVRRDTGDAGTGVGVELGGGLIWNAPRFGLNLDLSGRTLLASGIGGNRGFSAALNYDPSPANPRGLSLTLRQDLGGAATGGLAALFASDLPGAGFGGGARRRWSAEAAYGLPAFGGRFAASPTLSYGAFGGGRDYTLGWRLEPAADAKYAPDLSLGLRAIRREAVDASADHGVEVNARARW